MFGRLVSKKINMSRDEFEQLEGGKFRRKTKRKLGLFIDGTGLDRATRRLERKVDLTRLVAGLTSGLKPEIARYYTLVPYEDDARQFAFLDAVERAGLEVVVKRLPPKGVKRQVSMDVHIATDLLCFGYGHFDKAEEAVDPATAVPAAAVPTGETAPPAKPKPEVKRLATIVCPTRELSYSIFMSHELKVETSLADFGLYGSSDGWKGVDKWIDLSTSETIWRD